MLNELINKVFFVAAFLSCIWLWVFIRVGLAYPRLHDFRIREFKKKYADYCNKTGIENRFFKYALVFFYSIYLYPSQGLLLALSILIAFLIFKVL
jgi:hypothetical protein